MCSTPLAQALIKSFGSKQPRLSYKNPAMTVLLAMTALHNKTVMPKSSDEISIQGKRHKNFPFWLGSGPPRYRKKLVACLKAAWRCIRTEI